MARIDGKVLNGSVGNHSFRNRGGKQFVQSKPGKGGVPQTQKTKKAAQVFGTASKFSRTIRTYLNDLNYIHDGTMINRMNKEVASVLRESLDPETGIYNFNQDSFSQLSGFELNVKSALKESLSVPLETTFKDNQLSVKLPAFDVPAKLKFPKEANTCTMLLLASIFSIRTDHSKMTSAEVFKTLEISDDQKHVPEQEWTFEVPPGCFCVLGIALHYYKDKIFFKGEIRDKDFSPAMIADFIVNQGEFVKQEGTTWLGGFFVFD